MAVWQHSWSSAATPAARRAPLTAAISAFGQAGISAVDRPRAGYSRAAMLRPIGVHILPSPGEPSSCPPGPGALGAQTTSRGDSELSPLLGWSQFFWLRRKLVKVAREPPKSFGTWKQRERTYIEDFKLKKPNKPTHFLSKHYAFSDFPWFLNTAPAPRVTSCCNTQQHGKNPQWPGVKKTFRVNFGCLQNNDGEDFVLSESILFNLCSFIEKGHGALQDHCLLFKWRNISDRYSLCTEFKPEELDISVFPFFLLLSDYLQESDKIIEDVKKVH